MTRVLRARWVLPIDRPPIDGGWVEIAGGRIAAVGERRAPAGAEDLGDVALLPGLVNAHTHLELSWMAGHVPPSPSMDEWIRTLVRVRRAGPPGGAEAELRAATRAAASMRASGTVLVGDISNTLLSSGVLAEAGVGGVIFHELLGFNAANPARQVQDAWDRVDDVQRSNVAVRAAEVPLTFSVVAHAPYSVSAGLFQAIVAGRRAAPLSVHLGESQEEIEFLRSGLGPIRRALEDLGVWTDSWRVPATDPAEYLDRLGYLGPGCLAVHGVHLSHAALDRLRARDAVLVTCPRSNKWVGAGLPPISRFYGEGLRVAIGTDSLASTGSLNMFDELAELRRIAPDVAAGKLLESATRVGAEALGFGADFGTLAAGRRARLVSVRAPSDETDVEEYLVSGVAPESVQIPC